MALPRTALRVAQLATRPRTVMRTTASIRTFTSTQRSFEKRYTEDHEWIELSADKKIGTIGISEYAAKALGDVVFVELPTIDTEVDAGGAIGAVESVKSASDIMSPISGTVVEINSALDDKAGLINQSPEADAWLAKIEVKDSAEVEKLMDAQQYKKFTDEAAEDH